MTLVNIICGIDKPCKVVKPIKSYEVITGEACKHFLCKNPVCVTEMDNTCHICDLTEIAHADLQKAAGSVGDFYRIPNEYIEAV